MGTGAFLRFAYRSPLLACAGLLVQCRPADVATGECTDGIRLSCPCPEGETGYKTCQGDGLEAVCHCENEQTDASSEDDVSGDGDDPEDDTDTDTDEGDSGAPSPEDEKAAQCGEQQKEAKLIEERPVDVIFVIDNSGSMSQEIKGVEDNINENFARILNQRGADYRVIMVSDHGSSEDQQICIRAPLSQTDCVTIPSLPGNGERFFHYDVNVQSYDAWCHLLDGFDTPDQHGLAPDGWRGWLREEALKVFVVVTDDGIGCTWSGGTFSDPNTGRPSSDGVVLASAFESALFSLEGTQFGTAAAPNYVWHSVVGLAANSVPEFPYTSRDRLETGVCPTAVEAGAGYQMLSIGTSGLRFPVCDGKGFNSLFRAIAADVVQGAGIDCTFGLPPPPAGKRLDLDSVVVEYEPGVGGGAETFNQVSTDKCTNTGFVVTGTDVVLCEQACTRVRQDASAKLKVRFGCSADGIIF